MQHNNMHIILTQFSHNLHTILHTERTQHAHKLHTHNTENTHTPQHTEQHKLTSTQKSCIHIFDFIV